MNIWPNFVTVTLKNKAMKHFIFVCISFLFAFQSLVQATDIKFIKAEATEDLRSISFQPTATLDGNIISISTTVPFSDVKVVVKDMTGNAVYSETIIIPAGQPYSFVLDNAEEGDYVLEVTIWRKNYYGYFTLQ